MFNIASEKMRFKGANMPGADPGFFLGGGALVSCSISTPINLIVFFFAEYQLKTADHLRGGGGCVYIYIYIYIYKQIHPGNSPLDPEQCYTIKERFNSQ